MSVALSDLHALDVATHPKGEKPESTAGLGQHKAGCADDDVCCNESLSFSCWQAVGATGVAGSLQALQAVAEVHDGDGHGPSGSQSQAPGHNNCQQLQAHVAEHWSMLGLIPRPPEQNCQQQDAAGSAFYCEAPDLMVPTAAPKSELGGAFDQQHVQQQQGHSGADCVCIEDLDGIMPGFNDFSRSMAALAALRQHLEGRGLQGLGIFVPTMFPDVLDKVGWFEVEGPCTAVCSDWQCTSAHHSGFVLLHAQHVL